MNMDEIWKRIEYWLKENAPEVLESLQPGASDDEIKKAEEFMGVSFPSDFKQSYKIYNGQFTDQNIGFIQSNEFLSLDGIQEQWKIWKDLFDKGEFANLKSNPNGPVKNDWYNPKWIPITHNGAGDHFCLDLDPEKGGEVGQIISFWHDMDSRNLEANSFWQWLEQFACALEDDEYSVNEKYGLEL